MFMSPLTSVLSVRPYRHSTEHVLGLQKCKLKLLRMESPGSLEGVTLAAHGTRR